MLSELLFSEHTEQEYLAMIDIMVTKTCLPLIYISIMFVCRKKLANFYFDCWFSMLQR